MDSEGERAAVVAKGLTTAQRAALMRLSPSHMETARRLRISKSTLRALKSRGLAIGHADFMWRLSNTLGAAVRAVLLAQTTGERGE